MVFYFKGGIQGLKINEKKKGANNFNLISIEVKKNIHMVFRGESKVILLLTLVFPLMYLFFMSLVFVNPNLNYGMAIVIPDYDSDEDLSMALEMKRLPHTQEFLDYLNNNDLVGKTIIKSHIEHIGTSQEQFEDELREQEISLIVILPDNFEQIIRKVKRGTWKGGRIVIELKCLNLDEDYLKNVYFCFERKLKAYYDNILQEQVEVNYIYKDANPNLPTYPRIWTIGTGALVFLCLNSSMILSAAFIFNEKSNNMRPELALTSRTNQNNTYFGKIIAVIILSFTVDFISGALIVFAWIGLPLPTHFAGFLLAIISTLFFGACLGAIIGILIPEQVFTVPVSAFLIITTLFLCGGFINIEMFGEPMRTIIQFIPFTYCYALVNNSILTGDISNIFHIIGLVLYTCLFLCIGILMYQKYVIKSD